MNLKIVGQQVSNRLEKVFLDSSRKEILKYLEAEESKAAEAKKASNVDDFGDAYDESTEINFVDEVSFLYFCQCLWGQN